MYINSNYMKTRLLVLITLALACAGCSQSEEFSPILDIEGGQVQGVAADLDGVFVFRGIPYAAPPVGDLRWKEPQPSR